MFTLFLFLFLEHSEKVQIMFGSSLSCITGQRILVVPADRRLQENIQIFFLYLFGGMKKLLYLCIEQLKHIQNGIHNRLLW